MSFVSQTAKQNPQSKLIIISQYDQEIPQSQTADNPMAPRSISELNLASTTEHEHLYKAVAGSFSQ